MNSSHKAKMLVLEPWAEVYEIPAGKTFDVIADAEQEGSFEVEVGEAEITVYLWSSATARLYCDGSELI
jgi:hypothetical protein